MLRNISPLESSLEKVHHVGHRTHSIYMQVFFYQALMDIV